MSTSRVLAMFSFDLAWWPSFKTQVIQFQTWPRNYQDKHFEYYSGSLQQEAHGPRVAHLSDIATADMQMLSNIFPILSSQLMKRSSFK